MNFAARILDNVSAAPRRTALRLPDGTAISYGDFGKRVAGWQASLHTLGYSSGDRVVLLARPSIALYTLMTALLAAGIVPVLIERGMSRKRIAQSLRAAGAKAVIGERAVMRLWWLFPALWGQRRYALDGGGFGLRALRPTDTSAAPATTDLVADAHGIITFTSGSTGAPKGADRTHGSLIAQHLAIRDHWPDQPADIDCTFFPVLVLHNLCCGITTVLPDADLAAPGSVDPARLLEQLQRENVTRLSAAPATMTRLVAHCRARDVTLPGVTSVVIGGATLSQSLAMQCQAVFPAAHCRVVYGSTEAEPIADVDIPELARDWDAQPGHLVGRPAHAATVAIVDPSAPLDSDADVLTASLGAGRTGEILVAGAHVLRSYLDNPEATRASKIPRADGTVWHRTGDAGYFDNDGRLWLVGRLRDAVQADGAPLHTFPVEKDVDALPGVTRSALLQSRDGQLLLVVASNAAAGVTPDSTAVRSVLGRHALADARIAWVERMPVDGRHNSKIDRPALQQALLRGELRVPAGAEPVRKENAS